MREYKGSLQLVREMCKEKPYCKSAKACWEVSWGGQARAWVRRVRRTREFGQRRGQKNVPEVRISQNARDEQACAMVREFNVPQCSCYVQDERTGQRQTRCGERGLWKGLVPY